MPLPFALRIRCQHRRDDESGPSTTCSKQKKKNKSKTSGVKKAKKRKESSSKGKKAAKQCQVQLLRKSRGTRNRLIRKIEQMEKVTTRVMPNEGDHVAVVLSHTKQKGMPQTVYIAAVVKKNVDSVQLKFMEKVNGSTFIWPDGAKGDQIYTHPRTDVLCVLQPPGLEMRGRTVRYIFPPEDMEKIAKHVPGDLEIK